MDTNSEISPVEVFAGSVWEAEMVKSILEDSEIECFLKDEITGTLYPWYTASGGAGSVKVVVSSEIYPKAKIIVEEYEQNIRENT
jgi:hypothetical protein